MSDALAFVSPGAYGADLAGRIDQAELARIAAPAGLQGDKLMRVTRQHVALLRSVEQGA